MKKIRFEGWKGDFVDHYFCRLDKGEWVKINLLKYLWLKINNYTVRMIRI